MLLEANNYPKSVSGGQYATPTVFVEAKKLPQKCFWRLIRHPNSDSGSQRRRPNVCFWGGHIKPGGAGRHYQQGGARLVRLLEYAENPILNTGFASKPISLLTCAHRRFDPIVKHSKNGRKNCLHFSTQWSKINELNSNGSSRCWYTLVAI